MVVSPTANATESVRPQDNCDAVATLHPPRREPSEPGRIAHALGLFAPPTTERLTRTAYGRLLAALREPEALEPSVPAARVRLRIVKGEEETGFDELAPVRLDDIAGQEAVKARLRARVASARGERALRGGVLLWGAPGCGKTLLARGYAGELGTRCLRVNLADLAPAYAWERERKLRHIFDALHGRAPAVLLFDDLDALTRDRGEPDPAGQRRLVNHFLIGLRALLATEPQMFVLATTTRPWETAPLLRRAGRFDQAMFVPPPDADARAAILRQYADGDIDYARIARQTEGFSIPDLHRLCRSAGHARAQDTIDLLRMLVEVRAGTRAWLEVARNFAMFGEPRGDYEDLRRYLQAHGG